VQPAVQRRHDGVSGLDDLTRAPIQLGRQLERQVALFGVLRALNRIEFDLHELP
jgi:hypothetical protein